MYVHIQSDQYRDEKLKLMLVSTQNNIVCSYCGLLTGNIPAINNLFYRQNY